MFDFAWSELALIAVVALVVIGPKDLPRVMKMVAGWMRQARAIAREFQGSLDQMVRESELDDIKKHMDRATSFNVENEIRRAIDPHGEIQHALSAPALTNPLADPPTPVPMTEVQTASLEPPAVPESGPEPPPLDAPVAAPPASLEEARSAAGARPAPPTS